MTALRALTDTELAVVASGDCGLLDGPSPIPDDGRVPEPLRVAAARILDQRKAQ